MRLDTEPGAAVPEKVELDVSTAACALPSEIGRIKVGIFSLRQDVPVRVEEMHSQVLDEREYLVKIRILVIEEDAANAPGLASVRQKEVFVAPALPSWVIGNVGVASTDISDVTVKAHGVLIEQVIGRHVDAATKPPIAIVGFEVTNICVCRRCKRIRRMDDQRHTGRVKAGRRVGQMFCKFGGSRTPNRRHIHRGLFDRTATSDGPAIATTAFGTFPKVIDKMLGAARRFENGTTSLLDL